MLNSSKKYLWLLLSMFVVVSDQLSKYWALTTLEFAKPVVILPVLNFTLLFNTGAAFSFLSSAGGWEKWFFTFLALAICSGLLIWLYRLPAQDKLLAAALAFILGGAIGNLIDRARFGHVVDFISFHWHDWYFAVFNLADAAITLGAILIMLEFFLKRGE